MEAGFWHQRWQSNKIGFHETDTNPILIKHIDQLALHTNSRVFVPLCGKTLDIAWLLAQGFRVAGVELSELAVEQLFDELKITPAIENNGKLIHYSSHNIDIFAGDFFDLTATLTGPVDAVYDRAALVALPLEMRLRYTAHLISITRSSRQLLVCFEYDQTAMDGPPFSISAAEVRHHYQSSFHVSLLDTTELPRGLKGQLDASESVWLLTGK